MSPYLSLFHHLHTQPLPKELFPKFPRKDLAVAYLLTHNSILEQQLRTDLERIVHGPNLTLPHPVTSRTILYILPSTETSLTPNTNSYALFIRGATDLLRQDTAKQNSKAILHHAFETLNSTPTYHKKIEWHYTIAKLHLDTYEILRHHDQLLANLEYQEE
ncbi:hypothetical protein A2642_04970 [Candidatus Nomurabacteria bacterium RIFCSPHIGHO2_01_FULL_39_10]|uniref:Uncharacterized protein n=1 Tax=Candidatus Nomurabacteria bacterium RIFCSPHIGHO2_01_FULL_39_10 TaxID=1801733 RepID=A0A1F6V8T3_9BACT|nr:MAG: hypothetical protein A2642_04970 [Candidatus Nomurabacteria bacterium RIFCSPHIGHO2_01_FULL_39_10]